ncbi:hypothetical protein H6G00_03865 [Leptolyngbya sp. FACHB-541]|uniref:hypothetical protein n=1 Tax=Leptolyngbya sp. FACHB-541 TaxID=2692810 RepID=UPI0016893338|nr:hypothetical protein [Leptolyngbya sp. FACHB-541]MBD1995763.1 hypothetical protein [Leptolyngbya sp. FACHB-541]
MLRNFRNWLGEGGAIAPPCSFAQSIAIFLNVYSAKMPEDPARVNMSVNITKYCESTKNVNPMPENICGTAT